VSFFEPPSLPEPPEPPVEIPEPEPWFGAPRNELGAPVPLRVVLARTDQVAVAVVGVTAYTAGLSLTLAVRWRRVSGDEDIYREQEFPFDFRARWRPGELPPELLRFGVQFSDGRKATSVGGGTPFGDGIGQRPTRPILSESGGGGSEGEWDQDYWLWPLPPPGALTFAVEWPSKGLELTMHEVDAGPILEAAELSEPLWPESGADLGMSVSGSVVIGGSRVVSDEEHTEES